ncbi:hypothetical protein KEM56_007444 [Ascosphaera pollenicola]|nr:hypothetical protein KEM56_007444 [Ascosphaera pollenicola]
MSSAAAVDQDVCVAFTDVPPDVIEKLCEDHRQPRIYRFDKPNHIIIFKMPARHHEVAVDELDAMLRKVLERAQLWHYFSSARSPVEPPSGKRTGKGGSADVSIYLKHDYHAGYQLDEWPQIVGEVGTSEPQTRLERDARFWAQNGEDAVRVILTLKFFKKRVALTSWGTDANGNFGLEAQLIATQEEGHWVVTSPEISISVDMLLCREPASDAEADVEITSRDFAQMVERIETRRAEMPSGQCTKRPPPRHLYRDQGKSSPRKRAAPSAPATPTTSKKVKMIGGEDFNEMATAIRKSTTTFVPPTREQLTVSNVAELEVWVAETKRMYEFYQSRYDFCKAIEAQKTIVFADDETD